MSQIVLPLYVSLPVGVARVFMQCAAVKIQFLAMNVPEQFAAVPVSRLGPWLWMRTTDSLGNAKPAPGAEPFPSLVTVWVTTTECRSGSSGIGGAGARGWFTS